MDVPGFDDEREAAKDSLRGVELVGVPLQADERGDPGLQLFAVEGLGDEIVGAGPQAANLVFAVVQPRDQRDRNQPRLGRPLDLRANLEAVGAWHLNIEQHQVDAKTAKRRQGGFP